MSWSHSIRKQEGDIMCMKRVDMSKMLKKILFLPEVINKTSAVIGVC